MKVVAKKKTIVILIISFVLLLSAGLGFWFKDRIVQKKEFTPNIVEVDENEEQYELTNYFELHKYCEEVQQGDGTEIYLNCKGVLEEIITNDKNKCFKGRILTNNDTSLKKSIICVNEDALYWTNPYDTEKFFLPVNITLRYSNITEDIPPKSMTMTLLSDEEFLQLTKKNPNLNKISGRVLTKKVKIFLDNNFHLREFELEGNIMVKDIIFPTLLLKTVSVKNGQLELLFHGKIQKNEHDFIFYSNGFFYENTKTKDVTFISPNNYTKIKENEQYTLVAQFTNTPLPQNILQFCKSTGATEIKEGVVTRNNYANNSFRFCATLPIDLENMYIDNLDEYLKTSIEHYDNTKGGGSIILKKLRPNILIFFP